MLSWWLLPVLGFCLAGAFGAVVVTGRLFLLRLEALISATALLGFFFFGFAGPFFPHPARWFLAVAGFILFVLTAIFIGYTAKTRWSAGVTGAVFSPTVLHHVHGQRDDVVRR